MRGSQGELSGVVTIRLSGKRSFSNGLWLFINLVLFSEICRVYLRTCWMPIIRTTAPPLPDLVTWRSKRVPRLLCRNKGNFCRNTGLSCGNVGLPCRTFLFKKSRTYPQESFKYTLKTKCLLDAHIKQHRVAKTHRMACLSGDVDFHFAT